MSGAPTYFPFNLDEIGQEGVRSEKRLSRWRLQPMIVRMEGLQPHVQPCSCLQLLAEQYGPRKTSIAIPICDPLLHGTRYPHDRGTADTSQIIMDLQTNFQSCQQPLILQNFSHRLQYASQTSPQTTFTAAGLLNPHVPVLLTRRSLIVAVQASCWNSYSMRRHSMLDAG